MLPIQLIGAAPKTQIDQELIYYKFISDGNPMEYYIDYIGNVTDDDLKDKLFPLYLVDSTVSSDDLNAYYEARGVPEPYLTYLKKAVEGKQPYAYLNGANEEFVDGARYKILKIISPMAIPGDFPEGTYTIVGKVQKEIKASPTIFTFTLIVERDSGTGL
jgi:hypothetical protein